MTCNDEGSHINVWLSQRPARFSLTWDRVGVRITAEWRLRRRTHLWTGGRTTKACRNLNLNLNLNIECAKT
jgi:hypothetical protein